MSRTEISLGRDLEGQRRLAGRGRRWRDDRRLLWRWGICELVVPRPSKDLDTDPDRKTGREHGDQCCDGERPKSGHRSTRCDDPIEHGRRSMRRQARHRQRRDRDRVGSVRCGSLSAGAEEVFGDPVVTCGSPKEAIDGVVVLLIRDDQRRVATPVDDPNRGRFDVAGQLAGGRAVHVPVNVRGRPLFRVALSVSGRDAPASARCAIRRSRRRGWPRS